MHPHHSTCPHHASRLPAPACPLPVVFPERNAYTHVGDANALEFHSDQGATDLIALLSIAAAKEGGESLLVSAIAIHNELLRRGRKVGRQDTSSA